MSKNEKIQMRKNKTRDSSSSLEISLQPANEIIVKLYHTQLHRNVV